jgi:putative endonuclease
MFYVYILKSLKYGNIYTGFTANLEKRYQQHQKGEVISTKKYLPVTLIYYQAFISESDARREEKYLKSGGKAKNDLKSRIRLSLKSDGSSR